MSRFIMIGLSLLGVLLLSKGFYMDVKANLAQILISSSWDQRHEDRLPPKPWWWADTRPIAKMEVARLKQTLFVMQDASGESLAFGPGHLPQSAKPANLGHILIAGHRDSHFSFLKDVSIGDEITISDHRSNTRKYHVTEIHVIDSTKEQLLLTDNDQLTLITCYPFEDFIPGGPLRMLVHAQIVNDVAQPNVGS